MWVEAALSGQPERSGLRTSCLARCQTGALPGGVPVFVASQLNRNTKAGPSWHGLRCRVAIAITQADSMVCGRG